MWEELMNSLGSMGGAEGGNRGLGNLFGEQGKKKGLFDSMQFDNDGFKSGQDSFAGQNQQMPMFNQNPAAVGEQGQSGPPQIPQQQQVYIPDTGEEAVAKPLPSAMGQLQGLMSMMPQQQQQQRQAQPMQGGLMGYINSLNMR